MNSFVRPALVAALVVSATAFGDAQTPQPTATPCFRCGRVQGIPVMMIAVPIKSQKCQPLADKRKKECTITLGDGRKYLIREL